MLVLGAGLAGLRAAIAAAATPGSGSRSHSVALLAPEEGPSGSSFANRNARLGMLAPATADERELFARRAAAIAAPGFADPNLIGLMADEAKDRLEELRELGIPIQAAPIGPGGQAGCDERHPACFLPEAAMASILPDLPAAHARLRARFLALGGRELRGTCVALLRGPDGRVTGAAGVHPDGAMAVAAGAVVLAVGGPVPLCAPHLAGPGTGYGYGLLRHAGARLANCGYLQWMWYTTGAGERRAFFPIQTLAHPDARLTDAQGVEIPLAPALAALVAARATHCPHGFGLPDAALDHAVLAMAGPGGVARVRPPGGAWTAIMPMAHAGNGGAVIDSHGRTTAPGLYACGECATGMHGANRVGGAMVAATQVFGARAGAAAAREATAPPCETALRELVASGPGQAPGGEASLVAAPETTALLTRMLQGLAMRPGVADRTTLLAALAARMAEAGPGDRLRLTTAQCMVADLPDLP